MIERSDIQSLAPYYSCIKEENLPSERIEKFRKQFLCDEYPSSIALELGEFRCTHRCRMCPQSTIPCEGPDRLLDRDTLERILDRIHPERELSLEISAYGETFLHPQALPLIGLVRRRLPKAQVLVATNGLLVTERIAEGLLDTGVDCIQFSLNTGSAASYEWFCGRKDYDVVASNLRRLIRLRDQRGSSTKITTHILEIEELREEFLPFVQTWQGQVDRVYIRGYGNWGGMVNGNGLKGLHPIPGRRYPCISLFCSLEILSDGTAYKCFLHCVPGAETSGALGSLLETSIEEIWTGPRMQQYRRMHMEGRYDAAPFCNDCISWALFPNLWKA